MRSLGRLGTALCIAALLVTGCTEDAAPPAAVTVDWQEVALPSPPGPAGRPAPRDATHCGGRWYVVGAVASPDGATRPAAWESPDGREWRSVPTAPATYYGHRNVLYSVACRDGVLAAVGGKPGGAHGNPRVSTWYRGGDGRLVEVRAGFELYGGPTAVNVGRLAAGPRGWVIAGNRTSGAAVWTSTDATGFRILEGVPELASDHRGESWAFDVAPTGDGWLVVGGIIPAGRVDRDPMAWTSTDGTRWERVTVPATGDYEEFQRVVVAAGGPVAVGLRGDTFGSWQTRDGRWRPTARFGSGRSGRGAPAVPSLAAAGPRILAVTSDGTAHTVWVSADTGRSWRRVTAPTGLPAGADRGAALALGQDRVLLVADDGRSGRAWLATLPTRR